MERDAGISDDGVLLFADHVFMHQIIKCLTQLYASLQTFLMLLVNLLNHGGLNFEHIEIARTTVEPDGSLKLVKLIQECHGKA